jgi:predicted Zn finger-like uncharacterized protein
MNLYTRCLHCGTTFRVTTEQLQASSGQVRCGQCKQVFDAFATLTAQEPQSATPERDMPSPTQTVPPLPPRPVAKPPVEKSAPAQIPVRPKERPPTVSAVRPDPAASLYEWEFRMPVAPRRTGLWVSLSLLLLALLAVQGAYAFRAELMVQVPQSRMYYERVCEWLGCTVALSRLSSYLHIEASDLKVPDAARPGEIELLVAVRNRAPVEQDYPAFELTLTNSQEQTIARRVFLPAEYLQWTEAVDGLKAGAEMPIRLFLDTGELRAANYRLYMFYP